MGKYTVCGKLVCARRLGEAIKLTGHYFWGFVVQSQNKLLLTHMSSRQGLAYRGCTVAI